MKKSKDWLTTFRLPFTWSHSRNQLFEMCKRGYYVRYYAPYGGNSPAETSDRSQLYLLSKLVTAPSLLGAIVHTLAREWLTVRFDKPQEAIVNLATGRLRLIKALRESQIACVNQRAHSGSQVLSEHYYLQTLDEGYLVTQLDYLVKSLLAHPVYQEVTTTVGDIVSLDQVKRFDWNGVPVFSVPDILVKLDGRYRIIDWKTGRTTSSRQAVSREQLGIYALYVAEVYAARPEAIVCEVVDIPAGSSILWTVTSDLLAEAGQRISASIAEMKRRLTDVTMNRAERTNYPKHADAGATSAVCCTCNYRQVCLQDAPGT